MSFKDIVSRIFLNVFSSSELLFGYLFLISAIVFQNVYSLYVFIALILKSFILAYPKKLFKNSILGKRPLGAFDCNMFSCGGKPKHGGLISGHMTNVVMATVLILLTLRAEGEYNSNLVWLLSFIIITTGISRYLTKCHTLFQISLGVIVGTIFGYTLFIVQKIIERENDRFKEDKKKFYSIFKCINSKDEKDA